MSEVRREVYLGLTGLHCASCASRVEKAAALPGVAEVCVNLSAGEARVTFDPGAVSPEEVARAVRAIGFGAEVRPGEITSQPIRADAGGEGKSALLAGLLALPVGILGMAGTEAPWSRWTSLALTAALLAGPGRVFFSGAWAALLRRTSDMNTLVALGTATAFASSAWKTIHPGRGFGGGHLYFESAAVIGAVVLLGRFLESRARLRSADAVRALLSRQADRARRVTGGVEEEIPASGVRVGDLLSVRPGEVVPADGTVVEGASAVDESAFTGEWLPAEKAPGDAVVGGSLNASGSFVFRATRVGSETVLRRVAEAVRRAQASKAPSARLADRVSAIFVPVVLALASATFAGWMLAGYGLDFAVGCTVAVLVVACPCALGLATPAAVSVAAGRGAQLGVLFRSGEAMEDAGRVRILAVDKTGTLTEGKPRVVSILSVGGHSEEEVLGWAASAEGGSEHPLGAAVRREAENRGLAVSRASSFRSLPGAGVEAEVERAAVLVGSAALLGGRGLDCLALEEAASPYAQGGCTALFVAVSGRPFGAILLEDSLRADSMTAVGRLRNLGLVLVMVTGDQEAPASKLADALGIQRVLSGASPEGKAGAVAELARSGTLVGMAGDGVNDAPALAASSVGFAVGSAADAAREAGGVSLLRPGLSGVADAVALSRAALRIIRQNLFFSLLYNLLALPLAAGLLYPATGLLLHPMVASAAMAMSSVSVVANSLRLKRFLPAEQGGAISLRPRWKKKHESKDKRIGEG